MRSCICGFCHCMNMRWGDCHLMLTNTDSKFENIVMWKLGFADTMVGVNPYLQGYNNFITQSLCFNGQMITIYWSSIIMWITTISNMCCIWIFWQYGRGRMVGGWTRKKWVFGILGVKHTGQKTKPVLRLVERRTRRELIPLVLHHVRTGSTILTDEWRAYRQSLPEYG